MTTKPENTARNVLVLYSTEHSDVVQHLTRMGLSFVVEKHGGGPVHHACEVDGVVLEVYPAKTNDRIRFL